MIERQAEMPEDEESSETTTIPLSLVGNQPLGVGDVVRLRVVSVNDDDGTAEVSYDLPKKQPSNSEEMASDMATDSTLNIDA